jgi:hypothetical protein
MPLQNSICLCDLKKVRTDSIPGFLRDRSWKSVKPDEMAISQCIEMMASAIQKE